MAGMDMECAPGGLAEHLQNWRHHLSATERQGLTTRCVRFFREHWINMFVNAVFMLYHFVDIVLAESRRATRVPLRSSIGAYSGIASFLILTRRKHLADEALRLAASVANTLEREGSPSDQALLRREGRFGVFRTRFLAVYSIMTQIGVITTVLLEPPSFSFRLASEVAGVAGVWGLTLVHLHTVVNAHVDLYSLLALQLDSVRACAVLNTCIGHRFQAEGGRRSTARSAWLHAQVNESARLTSLQFGHLLPHFLTVGLVMPVVSTAEVISAGGHADSFALAMVPLLFVFFVSQCVCGQQLENSSEGLGWAAYQGPWLSEDTRARRSRLLVIRSVNARPACFGVPGIILLNHATCQDALRIWFQYLQILLNTSGKRERGPAQ